MTLKEAVVSLPTDLPGLLGALQQDADADRAAGLLGALFSLDLKLLIKA